MDSRSFTMGAEGYRTRPLHRRASRETGSSTSECPRRNCRIRGKLQRCARGQRQQPHVLSKFSIIVCHDEWYERRCEPSGQFPCQHRNPSFHSKCPTSISRLFDLPPESEAPHLPLLQIPRLPTLPFHLPRSNMAMHPGSLRNPKLPTRAPGW